MRHNEYKDVELNDLEVYHCLVRCVSGHQTGVLLL